MNNDVVVGIAGAVVLVLVMGGVFVYEYNNYEGGPLSRVDTDQTGTGDLAEGNSKDFTFDVDGRDLARLNVLLEWTDDVGENDVFQVLLLNPDGDTIGDAESDDSPLSISVALQEPPLEGPMPDAWVGVQTWTVRVTLTSAPGTTGAIPVLDTADGNQDFELTLTEVRYQPDA